MLNKYISEVFIEEVKKKKGKKIEYSIVRGLKYKKGSAMWLATGKSLSRAIIRKFKSRKKKKKKKR